jgi:hypothetical protein
MGVRNAVRRNRSVAAASFRLPAPGLQAERKQLVPKFGGPAQQLEPCTRYM